MNEIKCTLYKILRCENISRNNVDETAYIEDTDSVLLLG